MISLKGFHLFFIALSIATCWGLAVWGIHDHAASGNGIHRSLGFASLVCGLILSFYLVRIFSKFKRLEPYT